MSKPPPTSVFQSAPGPDTPHIPDHTLLRRIGVGSYGEVWLARNVMDALRAVKIVYRNKFESDRPYEREFAGIKRFEPISRRHQSQIDILHVGRNDASKYFYYVMELADDSNAADGNGPENAEASKSDVGPTARSDDACASYSPKTLSSELARHGRFPVMDCVRLGLTLATALEHLHTNGLIHRDIKPSNIVYIDGQPKLADLGLVTDVDASQSFAAGTPGYIPPEGHGTPSADIFSLGKVLYEISTGLDREEFPNVPEGFNQWSRKEQKEWLEFNAIVLKACQRIPAKRHRNVGELVKELKLLEAGQSIHQLHALQRQFARLKFWVLPWAAVLIGGAFVFWWKSSAEARATRREVGLREVQMIRGNGRENGWFDKACEKLREVSRLRKGDDVRNEAAACLNGPDAKLAAANTNAGSFRIAFSPDGLTLLCGGVSDKRGRQPAHIWSLQHSKLQVLPVTGDAVPAWKSDGTPVLFLVGSSTNSFVLAEALTGKPLREFTLQGNPIQGNDDHPVLALSPDGRLAAASVTPVIIQEQSYGPFARPSNSSGRFAVWNTETSEVVKQLDEPASALAFSPDGRALAVGHPDGRIRVFALLGSKSTVPTNVSEPPSHIHPAEQWQDDLIAELPSIGVRINCFAFTRDPIVRASGPLTNAWRLAMGDAGGGIRIYELSTHNQLRECRGSFQDVLALAFNIDGTILASAGRLAVRLWDVGTGGELLKIPANPGVGISPDYVRALAFSPDGQRLALANERQTQSAAISIWEVIANHGIKTFCGLSTPVFRVWFSPHDRYVVALESSWRLGIWDLQSERLLRIFETPQGDTADNAGVAFHPDGKQLAFCMGNEARLVDLETGQTKNSWTLHWGFGDSLCFDAAGRLLSLRRERPTVAPSNTGPESWCLRILNDQANGEILRRQLVDQTGRLGQLAFASSGKNFILCGYNVIRFYETESGKELWHFDYLHDGMMTAGIDPSSRWMIHRFNSTNAVLRALPRGDVVDYIPGIPEAISPSGTVFAVFGDKSLCNVIFGRSTPLKMLRLGTEPAPGSAWPEFSGDSRHLAWGSMGGLVFVADLPTIEQRLKDLKVGIEIK